MSRARWAWDELVDCWTGAHEADKRRLAAYPRWRRPFEQVVSLVAWPIIVVLCLVFMFPLLLFAAPEDPR